MPYDNNTIYMTISAITKAEITLKRFLFLKRNFELRELLTQTGKYAYAICLRKKTSIETAGMIIKCPTLKSITPLLLLQKDLNDHRSDLLNLNQFSIETLRIDMLVKNIESALDAVNTSTISEAYRQHTLLMRWAETITRLNETPASSTKDTQRLIVLCESLEALIHIFAKQPSRLKALYESIY
jgi:hypothetical protein